MTRPTTLPVPLIQERNHGGAEENLAAIEARHGGQGEAH